MKVLSKFIFILSILLMTSSAYAEYKNYDEYRLDIDNKIIQLNYKELRDFLSNQIHKLKEPWEISFYKECLTKKIKYSNEGKVYHEVCDKFLTENLQQRYQRLELIVDAIILELDNAQDKFNRSWFWTKEDLAFMILVKIHNESSKFSLNVHKGIILGDSGKSFGLGQIWSRGGDPYARKEIVGYNENKLEWSLQQTRNNIFMVARHLTFHLYRCVAAEKLPSKYKRNYDNIKINAYRISRVYSGYATGWACNPGFEVKRNRDGVETFEKHWEPLRRANKVWVIRNKFLN